MKTHEALKVLQQAIAKSNQTDASRITDELMDVIFWIRRNMHATDDERAETWAQFKETVEVAVESLKQYIAEND